MGNSVLKTWAEEQHSRRVQVHTHCALFRSNYQMEDKSFIENSNIYIDDEHKFMYCSVPGAAATNIKRTILALGGHVDTYDPAFINADSVDDDEFLERFGLTRLSSYTLPDIKMRLDNYVKFMFVRHPFERLVSSYRAKFLTPTKFRDWYGRRIIRQYRDNPSYESLQNGTDVRFEEFIKFIIDEVTIHKSVLTANWRPYHKLCYPCHIKWDYIGKLETLYQDAKHIFDQTHFNADFQFPDPVRNSTFIDIIPETRYLINPAFDRVPAWDVERLMEIFAMDFLLYDYDFTLPGVAQTPNNSLLIQPDPMQGL